MSFRHLYNSPYINRRRRRYSLRRTDNARDYLETIIIHSDSSDEERRLNDEIDNLKNKIEDFETQKVQVRRELARKYKELQEIRVARAVKKNNVRLKRELQSRLLPTIERIASRRQEIVHGLNDLFDNIDDNEDSLPPSYESLFPSTPTANGSTTNPASTSNGNDNDNDSSSSDSSLPSVNSIFNNILNP